MGGSLVIAGEGGAVVGHEETGTGSAWKMGDNGGLGADGGTGGERRLFALRRCAMGAGEVFGCGDGLIIGRVLPAGGAVWSCSRDVEGADGAPGGDQVGDEMRAVEFGGDLQRQVHGRLGTGLEPPLTIVETIKAEP